MEEVFNDREKVKGEKMLQRRQMMSLKDGRQVGQVQISKEDLFFQKFVSTIDNLDIL